MQVRGIEVKVVVEQEDVIEQTSGSESYEHGVCEYIKTLTEKLNTFKSESNHKTLKINHKRLLAIKNLSQMNSFLVTGGSSIYKSSGALKRKIACQPTSIARRQQGQPKGRATLIRGRIVKRKRNLAHNINLNQPIAKIH